MAINFSFLSKLTTTTTPQSHYSLLHNNKHTQTHFILNRHSHRPSHQAYNISYTYLHIGRYTVLGTHTCTYVNTYLHTHTHPQHHHHHHQDEFVNVVVIVIAVIVGKLFSTLRGCGVREEDGFVSDDPDDPFFIVRKFLGFWDVSRHRRQQTNLSVNDFT